MPEKVYCSAGCTNAKTCLYKTVEAFKDCPCEECIVKVKCKIDCQKLMSFIYSDIRNPSKKVTPNAQTQSQRM